MHIFYKRRCLRLEHNVDCSPSSVCSSCSPSRLSDPAFQPTFSCLLRNVFDPSRRQLRRTRLISRQMGILSAYPNPRFMFLRSPAELGLRREALEANLSICRVACLTWCGTQKRHRILCSRRPGDVPRAARKVSVSYARSVCRSSTRDCASLRRRLIEMVAR